MASDKFKIDDMLSYKSKATIKKINCELRIHMKLISEGNLEVGNCDVDSNVIRKWQNCLKN